MLIQIPRSRETNLRINRITQKVPLYKTFVRSFEAIVRTSHNFFLTCAFIITVINKRNNIGVIYRTICNYIVNRTI